MSPSDAPTEFPTLWPTIKQSTGEPTEVHISTAAAAFLPLSLAQKRLLKWVSEGQRVQGVPVQAVWSFGEQMSCREHTENSAWLTCGLVFARGVAKLPPGFRAGLKSAAADALGVHPSRVRNVEVNEARATAPLTAAMWDVQNPVLPTARPTPLPWWRLPISPGGGGAPPTPEPTAVAGGGGPAAPDAPSRGGDDDDWYEQWWPWTIAAGAGAAAAACGAAALRATRGPKKLPSGGAVSPDMMHCSTLEESLVKDKDKGGSPKGADTEPGVPPNNARITFGSPEGTYHGGGTSPSSHPPARDVPLLHGHAPHPAPAPAPAAGGAASPHSIEVADLGPPISAAPASWSSPPPPAHTRSVLRRPHSGPFKYRMG